MVSPVQRICVFLSLCTASVAALICQYQQHFTLALDQPHSFVVMTHHRCGQLLIASCLWMTAETLTPTGRSRPWRR